MSKWADKDGVIPITRHLDELMLLDRVRDRFGNLFGHDRVYDIKSSLSDVLQKAAQMESRRGRNPTRKISLGQWIERDFFKRHTNSV